MHVQCFDFLSQFILKSLLFMSELKVTSLKFLELVQLCPFKSSPRFLLSGA